MQCFNNFVQSAVNARREADEKPHSIVVAEAMKLLANRSFGYQIMDRNRHTVKKYLSDEKSHGVITKIMFKHLGYINDQLYEMEIF